MVWSGSDWATQTQQWKSSLLRSQMHGIARVGMQMQTHESPGIDNRDEVWFSLVLQLYNIYKKEELKPCAPQGAS